MWLLLLCGGIFIQYYVLSWMYITCQIATVLSVVCLGLAFGWYMADPPVKNQPKYDTEHKTATKILLDALLDDEISQKKKPSVVISRTVDQALEEVMDHILRDALMIYLQDLVHNPNAITKMIKCEMWLLVENFYNHLCKMDQVKFLMQDIITKVCHHYQKIRQSTISEGKEPRPVFLLRPYLKSEESELGFLRKVSDVFINMLLPEAYRHSMPVRHLIREILTCKVLHPAIAMITDPDYLNQKLLNYLRYHQEVMEHHKKNYAYTATYEGFVKMIEQCSNLEHLNHLRFNIMTEIMHASTINNLKKAGKIHALDKEAIAQGAGKGDLLQVRNLKRYINQLTFAKSLCERRIKLHGGMNVSSLDSNDEESGNAAKLIQHDTVLSFPMLMKNTFAQGYFMKYLEKDDLHPLLEYWNAVEEMKKAEKKFLHELAGEIFQIYIPSISNILKLDRTILKGMEALLIGNKGPESFIIAQEEAYTYLEKRTFPGFLVSDMYSKMLFDANVAGADIHYDNYSTEHEQSEPLIEQQEPPSTNELSIHYMNIKADLEQIEDKLQNKIQALCAVKNTHKMETKVIIMLEKEIHALKMEKKQLQTYASQTEAWISNIGQWQINVHTIEFMEEKDKITQQYVLDVYLNEDYSSENKILPIKWEVQFKYSDFVAFNAKILQLGRQNKLLDLPKPLRIRHRKVADTILEKHLSALQKYLDSIMLDDFLMHSGMLYKFLSVAPENFKQGLSSPKKAKFSLTSVLRSTHLGFQADATDDDDFLFFEDVDSTMKDDRIAEPLYTLMGEVFDMRGFSNLLRRTLMSFVQITFGKTINRQVREMFAWLFSESMLVYYIQRFRDSFWPGGTKCPRDVPRQEDEILKTRDEAREKLMSSIPDILVNLVGQQNARKGANKIFESLQDVRLNKQLLYELLETFILEIFPQLKS